MPASVEMTRQELYDLVWSKPMRDAAATIPTMVLPHRIGLPGVHAKAPKNKGSREPRLYSFVPIVPVTGKPLEPHLAPAVPPGCPQGRQ